MSFRFATSLFLMVVANLWQGCNAQAGDNPNALAVGKSAKIQTPVDIQTNPVANFNWKTREEVLNMRKKEIYKYPQLLLNTYTPYPPIWGAVEDNRPWWGTTGTCIWGEGQKSIEGPAEESRYILNPFMLVGVNPATLSIWNPSRIRKDELNDPKFPYFWYPESIRFEAAKSFATATFNISQYLADIRKTGALNQPNIMPNQFSLVAYNARDFGYGYIWLNEARSINVSNDNRFTEPTTIRQMLHCGGTCGYEGGCNNMSPFMKEIDRCRINKLPARACVYLWRDEPQNVAKRPDFIFLLDFK